MSTMDKENKAPNKTAAKRKASDALEQSTSPAKRTKFGDVTARLTAEEINGANKEDLVAHVLALQDHIASLGNCKPAEMTSEELEAKVKTARDLMIAGF